MTKIALDFTLCYICHSTLTSSLYFSLYFIQTGGSALCNTNQPMTTDKQANHYQAQVYQQELKPPQTEYVYVTGFVKTTIEIHFMA